MKTINNEFRSKVMKAAWKIFRKRNWNFGTCLRRAWEFCKANILESDHKIYEIVKETERAILAVIDSRYDHVREEDVDITMWVPKSVIVNNMIPDWFYRKNR
ncbi:MAG: hypothetical protein LC101_01425 [Flavobacteriales bacterium]|jgi:hypothetical protein|nr:hypothetical protein [Flavobacteriales bacterium]OQC56246.1 MAG: hypothetical protein BWX51_02132 [Bacteroidetes bacterium ADurb.Bin012]HPM11689.1 hypothetical protein [Paludibacter sp.]